MREWQSLALLVALLSACGEKDRQASADGARLDALEARVATLSAQLASKPLSPPTSARFDIDCPSPWQVLSSGADVAWACRADKLSPQGLWANCNVLTGPPENLSARDYFEASLDAVPQLRAAKRIAGRAARLADVAAYEAIYEHTLLGRPLRVLATVAATTHGVYAVSCSASPEEFDAQEAIFRAITSSFRFKR